MKCQPRIHRIFKILHLAAASCWMGGAFSLLTLHGVRLAGVLNDAELHGIDRAAHAIDIAVVIAGGAMGCLLTGLLLSLFTGWGFFRHRWVMAKWAATLGCIAFGTFCLGPWERAMLALSGAGTGVLASSAYLVPACLNAFGALLQIGLLIFMVCISVIKPWNGTRHE